ncbi:MAG: AAA family ATPase [Nannocystaceae bacterium]
MPDDPSHSPLDEPRALEALQATQTALVTQLERRVFGQRQMIEELLVALVARGHAIFVGVPGLAKTLIVQSLADATSLDFGRIQFTPDLMPADITGTEVLDVDPRSNEKAFRFVPGPIFANLILADEINRTPPKTQAALLQAMQEGQVHAGGRAHQLPRPFHVFATRNPIEQEGTYPLPEAQLDRFMLEIEVRYPSRDDEARIITLDHRLPADIEPVLDGAQLQTYQGLAAKLPVPDSVVAAVVALIRASRPEEEECPARLRELIRWGAGPRAGQQLIAAARARAALRGRACVVVEDVKTLAQSVLAPRIIPSFAAESRGISAREIIAELCEGLPS